MTHGTILPKASMNVKNIRLVVKDGRCWKYRDYWFWQKPTEEQLDEVDRHITHFSAPSPDKPQGEDSAEDLKHDLTRQYELNTELVNENAKMEEALIAAREAITNALYRDMTSAVITSLNTALAKIDALGLTERGGVDERA